MIERGSPEWHDRADEHLKTLQEMIKQYGWTVQGVFDAEGGPFFSYTVGLTEAGLPELIVSGLGPQQGIVVLNNAAKVHSREELEHGHTSEEIITVEMRVIDAPRAEIGMATRLYGETARAVQIVWPDDEGLFPAQDGKMTVQGSEIEQPLYGPIWWT